MVRAILINPVERTVSETVVPEFWLDIRAKHEGDKLNRVAVLPAGDAVYVPEEPNDAGATFSLGGSKPFAGYGLVLGKRGPFAIMKDAVTDLDGVASIVDFGV